MKYYLFSFLLIASALSPAFSQNTKQSAPEPIRPLAQTKELSDEDSIREVVFKKVIGPWMKEFDSSLAAHFLETYYIAVDDDKDPSPELLERFSGLLRPVRKASESYVSEPEGNVVKDKKTNKNGVLFTVSRIKWVNKNEVTLTAGSYIANMGSDGCRYSLKRVNGAWSIASKEECFVS